MSQLFSAPAHICTCKAVVFTKMLCTDFFFFPFEALATLAWFSFSVSNNSTLLNTAPPLRLSVLFMFCVFCFPCCLVPVLCVCFFVFLVFFFFFTAVWMCISPIKHVSTSCGADVWILSDLVAEQEAALGH